MSRGRKITNKDIAQMQELSAQGLKHAVIAEWFGVHQGTVSRNLKEYRKEHGEDIKPEEPREENKANKYESYGQKKAKEFIATMPKIEVPKVEEPKVEESKIEVPKIEVPNQEAKADAGKPDLTLVPRQIITEIAKIRAYGNAKYNSTTNWKQVEPNKFKAAAFRHLLAYLDDPRGVDEESGLPHLSHLACNVAFLIELGKEEKEKDPAWGFDRRD